MRAWRVGAVLVVRDGCGGVRGVGWTVVLGCRLKMECSACLDLCSMMAPSMPEASH